MIGASPIWLLGFLAELLRDGVTPGTSILVSASQRVPVLQVVPDLLAGDLRILPQFDEIDARNNTGLHHHMRL